MKKSPYKKAEFVIAVAVLLYGLVLLFRIINVAVLSAPYPNEYREAANIAMTRAIKAGVNIYSNTSADLDSPTVCYLYGPLMSLPAALFSWLLPGVDVQVIHYAISILSIIGSSLLLALMVKSSTRSVLSLPLTFVLGIFCHWRYGYVCGSPDSFGLLIMTGVLFLLFKGARAGDKKGWCFYIEGAAALTLASFFTKQYFLMVAAVGAIYLLIISRRLFLRYVVSGIAFSVIIFWIIAVKFPLYFTYAIYFLKGPGPGAAMGKTGISYNNMQVSYLGGMLLALFVAVFILTVSLVIRAVGSVREKKAMDITDRDFMLLFYVQAAVSALVLRYIGNNDGAFLSYYLQLFTPALAALAVYSLDRGAAFIEEKKLSGWIYIALCVIFIGYTVYKVEPRLVTGALSGEELSQWQEAYATVDEYADEGEIYFCPLLDYYAYSHDMYVYNDGQPFVFTQRFLESYEKSQTAQKLFPRGGDIIAKHLSFREEMREKVRRGDYSLVMRMEDMDEVFPLEELSMHYEKKKTFLLRAGSWAWEVEFWTRRV